MKARRGDRLEHGFVVERVLGQGATAIALLVKKGDKGKESVHKVAMSEDQNARLHEERLRHAHGDGGFLVLTVRPSRMRRCEDELLRRFRLERVSFDDLLFAALRREAEALDIDWKIGEQADGADRSSQDWNNLRKAEAAGNGESCYRDSDGQDGSRTQGLVK